MASLKQRNFEIHCKRILSIMLVFCLVIMVIPLSMEVSAAEETISVGYQPTIQEEMDASGFKHPGIGLTKDILENMRTQVLAQKEPWYSYYSQMAQSQTASQTVTSSNQSSTDPTKPGSLDFNSQSFNSKFIADSLKAYTQAIMYYVTGEEVYRANAMRIIRIWSQMDPTKYKYFTDAHIHTGIPLNRMVTAAEILRYTSSITEELKWTDKDTTDFTANLINPVINTFQHNNGYFMNQHTYPLLGAMSGYIFTGNRDRYNEGVEWFTVNESAVDQGQNGSIKQLFRLVDTDMLTGETIDPPRVQHVEMGRDQAHGAGDLTNAEILCRLLEAQGTRVDPVEGTVSTAENAVNAYEFLDNRILKAADYFARFMLGHDTPWTPVAAHTDTNGNPTIIYKELAEGYRGRIGGNVYGLYYYYKYAAGANMEEEAPYYDDMFNKRLPFYWESPDGGADYWMFIPKEAAIEGTTTLPKVSANTDWNEIEYRSTSLDPYSTIKQEDDTSFVEITATEEGSRISIVSTSTSVKTIGLRIRTNGTAKLTINGWENAPLILPDTKGQWKYVTYTMENLRGLSDLTYFKIKGTSTIVDIDHIHLKAVEQLTPPVFKFGSASLDLFTYVGSQSMVRYDFSATDAGDSVTYQIDHKPEGAQFDESNGAFSWKPEQAGSYSLVVGAMDGTSITAKEVNVTVSSDRQSAIEAVIAPYSPATSYVSASLENYKSMYDDVMNVISTATDDEFLQKLVDLRAAVVGLQPLTPLLKDGSVDYSNMLVAATFYNETLNLLDNYAGSFAFYGNAVNLTHTMDFGPDFKVSATAFSLQVRASFPERIGGTALFGSNDKETWTRLTPELTVVSEDMQTLEVSDEYRNTPFRFFKIQMIEPSSTMLELSEFRIFGERHESNNKLQSLSLSSPQSVQNRVDAGDTVLLSFQSTEPIQDVKATIQGHEATVYSVDQLNWTASTVLNNLMPTGKIQFAIEYKTANGLPATPAIFTTDNSLLYFVNQSKFLDVPKLATVIASDKQYGTNGLSKEEVGYLLFDGNTATYGDLAIGSGSYYTVDFGPDAWVKLSDIMLIPRASYPGRMNGVVLQGSNDNVSWSDLTPAVSGTAESTWMYIGGDKIMDNKSYRYLRIYNSSSWNGNIAEVEFYGEYDIQNIDSKVLGPDGYTKLSYYQYMQEVERIRAAISQPVSDKLALLEELFQAKEQLVSLASLPTQKITVTPSMVAASTAIYQNKGTKEENGWRAFDNNVATFTDTTEATSWIDIDLGEANAKSLISFKFYPRNGKASEITRVNGAILQGSNDGTNYTNLYTISGINTVQWYTAPITNDMAFRYLRYYSPGGYANVAELELYRKPMDQTLLAVLLEQADALQEGIYDEDRYSTMLAAKSLARTVVDDANSSQAQIDSAANKLLQAMEQLVVKPVIVSLKAVAVTTVTGTAPELPTVVNAVYSDETAKLVPVEWNTIDPILYSTAGRFTVNGAVYGTTLPAVANVTVIDKGAPQPPTNLYASSITAASLVLNWSASMDNVAVTGYEVFLNGQLAGTVTGDTYQYDFSGLAPDTDYTFRVVAIDDRGNRTPSADFTARTLKMPDETPPTAPGKATQYTQIITSSTGEMDSVVTGSQIKVKLVVKDGAAEVALSTESLSEAIANAVQSKQQALLIDLKAEETVSSIKLELPADAWRKVKEEGIKSVTIEFGLVSLKIVIDAFPELDAKDKLVLTVERVSPSTLPVNVSDKLKAKPVFEFSLAVDGQSISDFQGSKAVEVSIPYTPEAEENLQGLVAAYINDQGQLEAIRSSKYDATARTLVFYAKHFSKYAVVSNQGLFKDMSSYSWAQDSVIALAARHIVDGVGNAQFAPERTVTRAEFLKMMMEAYDLVKQGSTASFTDVKAGRWYSDAVATAQAMKIVNGYEDGSFGLEERITREEMAVVAIRILTAAEIELPLAYNAVSFQDASDIADYATAAVKGLNEAGFIEGQGNGSFAPKSQTTRAEAAVLIARMMGLN